MVDLLDEGSDVRSRRGAVVGGERWYVGGARDNVEQKVNDSKGWALDRQRRYEKHGEVVGADTMRYFHCSVAACVLTPTAASYVYRPSGLRSSLRSHKLRPPEFQNLDLHSQIHVTDQNHTSAFVFFLGVPPMNAVHTRPPTSRNHLPALNPCSVSASMGS